MKNHLITVGTGLIILTGLWAASAFAQNTREATDADLEHAIGLMTKHRALEDTIGRAHHYGAIARDALALFPDSAVKAALVETVDFCIARTH